MTGGYLERKLAERFGDRPLWGFVTGASRHPGVGAGIAGELLAAGFHVVAHCGRRARNPWLDKQAEIYGRMMIQVQMDFGDARAMPAFVDRIGEALEQHRVDTEGFAFDVVAHVAGVSVWGNSAEDVSLDEIDHLLNVNALSALYLTQTFWKREMITHPGGLVALIGSNHWYKAYSRFLGYAISKSAVERIAAHLAMDLAPHDVQVAHITLGWVDCERHYVAKAEGRYDYETWCAALPTGQPAASWEPGADVLGLLLCPSKVGNASRLDCGEHLLGH